MSYWAQIYQTKTYAGYYVRNCEKSLKTCIVEGWRNDYI